MQSYFDIRRLEFHALSEAKAKLSALIRKLKSGGKRLVLTHQGQPTAVLLSYQDYLTMSENQSEAQSASQASPTPPKRILTLEEWRRGAKRRREVAESIAGLFDLSKLPRKGQKPYKQKVLREFSQAKKTTRSKAR